MTKKLCIITGANSGIGKEAAIQMAKEGYYVIIACRNEQRGKKALAEIKKASKSTDVELNLLDLSLISSTKSFADSINSQYKKVDVLIHNAAIFDISEKEARFTKEGYETVWMTNHVNPVTLTYMLLDKIKASENGRILTVSSKGLLAKPFLKVDLDDPEFRNKKFSMTNAYYQSKQAQVMFTYHLAKELEGSKATINCVRVTAVKVDMSRLSGVSGFMKWVYEQKSKQAITPEEMAKTYTYLATSDAVAGISGKVFDEKNQQVESSKYMKDPEIIESVMKLTRAYLK
ncbi:MAG: SDR family NAD(P)-dependent oxidoreductase [Eubacteriales bacterium]